MRRLLARLHVLRIPWLAMVLVVLAGFWTAAEGAALFLRVRFAPVRSQPSLDDGGGEGFLYAGQQVEVLEKSKDGQWLRVRFQPEKPKEKDEAKKAEAFTATGLKEGWVHATLLSERARPETAERAWLSEGSKGLPRLEPSASARHALARRIGLEPVLEIEGLAPSAKDLDEFLKKERLGIYREDWPALEGGVLP